MKKFLQRNKNNIGLILMVIEAMVLLVIFLTYSVTFLNTGIKEGAFNTAIILFNFFLVIATFLGVSLNFRSNRRAEKLFIGQNKPLIDVTPLGVAQSSKKSIVTTHLSVVNYSGFKAYYIDIDLKYGKNQWIGEWRKARKESEKKKNQNEGVEKEKMYLSKPLFLIDELKPGGRKETEIEIRLSRIAGSLDLETDVKPRDDKGLTVLVRVTWQNRQRHTFDEVHPYRLICTDDGGHKNIGKGRAFTFLPEGILSKKKE